MKTDKNSRTQSTSGTNTHPEQAFPDTNLIRSIGNCRQLRHAIEAGFCEFRLLLMGGAYSRKTIAINREGLFRVVNHIDGSVQKLTGRELYTQSNIGEAMQKGALVAGGQRHE